METIIFDKRSDKEKQESDLIFSNPKPEPLDFTVLHTLNKNSKKSTRWITCSLCGKTITKNSMVRHYFAFHNGDE